MNKVNERWNQVTRLSKIICSLDKLIEDIDGMRIDYDGERNEPVYQHTNEELLKVKEALSLLGWHIVQQEVLLDKKDDFSKYMNPPEDK